MRAGLHRLHGPDRREQPERESWFRRLGCHDEPVHPEDGRRPPRPPKGRLNPSTTDSTYDGPTGQFKYFRNTHGDYDPNSTGHGHNAYFATTAEDLAKALTEILNATAAGDYTTSAPVSGLSVGFGSQVFLASTTFPQWYGRLQAFDTSVSPDPVDPSYKYKRLWEAGGALNARTDDRLIFTWDPANSNALVRIDTSDTSLFGASGKLSAIAGVTVSQQVGDFILGNDGTVTGTKREWILGPIVNSTPAIVGAPSPNYQTKTYPHSVFEGRYTSRKALLWVGSDDGMLHAFRAVDFKDPVTGVVLKPGGEEIVALVPPTLLAKQVELYATYQTYLGKSTGVTGQPPSFAGHLYGVANAVRFGDVYSSSWGGYKTVAFIAMGPGFVQNADGTMAAGQNQLIAIDITHPTPGTPTTTPPTRSRSSGRSRSGTPGWSGVSVPWSVPSLAPGRPEGGARRAGRDELAAPDRQRLRRQQHGRREQRRRRYRDAERRDRRRPDLQPAEAPRPQSRRRHPPEHDQPLSSITKPTSPVPYVGNQTFADTVFLDKSAKSYQNDNLADLGLQADLYGQVWFVGTSGGVTFSSVKVGIDAQSQGGPAPADLLPARCGRRRRPDPGNGHDTRLHGLRLRERDALREEPVHHGPERREERLDERTPQFLPEPLRGRVAEAVPAVVDSARLLANTNGVATATGLFRATLGSLLRPRPPA